jgi:TRAP-type C4-dicarboxylate transport system substrate-binding protein
MKKLFLIPVMVAVIGGLIFSGCAEPAPGPAPGAPPAELPSVNWVLQSSENSLKYYDVHEFVRMCDRISRRTDGKFKIKVALSGEMGISRDESVEAVSRGELEMCSYQTGFGEAYIPFHGVFHCPYLATTYEGWVKVKDATMAMTNDAFAELGVQPLAPWAYYQTPPQDLTTVEPVADLCDLDGRKIRTSRKLDIDLVNAMGGEGIYMDFKEVYMAMQRGVIDGLITGVQAMHGSAMYEVSFNVYPISLPPVSMWTIVNVELFEALPEFYKTVLLEEAKVAHEEIVLHYPKYVEGEYLALGSLGMTRRALTDAEQAAWQAKAIALWDTWADTPERKEALRIAKQVMGL